MKKVLILAFAASVAFAACNKTTKTLKTLNGSWNITKVDGSLSASVSGTAINGTLTSGSGSVTLSTDDYKGSIKMYANYSIPFMGQTLTGTDTTEGTITNWVASDKSIAMSLKDNTGSTSDAVWTIKTNESDNQVWTRTTNQVDGSDFQTMTYNVTMTKK